MAGRETGIRRRAFKWLVRMYGEDGVYAQRRGVPDFITRDGRRWVVKRVYGRTVWFYPKTFDRVKYMDRCWLLVFDAEGEEPIAVIQSSMLEPDAVIEGVRIKVTGKGEKYVPVSVETYRELSKVKGLMAFLLEREVSFDEVIRMLLAHYPQVEVSIKPTEEFREAVERAREAVEGE